VQDIKCGKASNWLGNQSNLLKSTPTAIVLPLAFVALCVSVWAQEPSVLDPNLTVRTVVSGLNQPTTMAFLGSDDFLVLEKPAEKCCE
jgi:hypothetical protein